MARRFVLATCCCWGSAGATAPAGDAVGLLTDGRADIDRHAAGRSEGSRGLFFCRVERPSSRGTHSTPAW